jgi:hypothetical protein
MFHVKSSTAIQFILDGIAFINIEMSQASIVRQCGSNRSDIFDIDVTIEQIELRH